MSDLRAAIVGYGLAGRVFHAPLIAATPGLSVGVIVTADASRSAQAASEHPHAQIVATADAALARDDIDFVVVATPNASHVPLARAAIARGLPVVVDKPLALGSSTAAALAADAGVAGVPLTVFHNRRWDSDQVTLRELIAHGALGEVLRYESRFERWRPEPDRGAWRQAQGPAHGGGLLLDLGTHLVDQALALFGPVDTVYAEIACRRGTLGEDDAFLALTHASGVISHLHVSALAAAPGPRLRVLGSEAAYLVTALDSQEDALREGRRPAIGAGGVAEGWGAEPFQRGRLVTGDVSLPVGQPGAWPEFYLRWERTLRAGAPPPVDPHDAVAVLSVLELARDSASSGAVVASRG